MKSRRLSRAVGAAIALAAVLAAPGTANADDDVPPGVEPSAEPGSETEVQHNVTYRARVDGLARGALITYRISDSQVNSTDPAMLPGRTFEANAVLSDPAEAGMRISIQWPYSANLHCEILVDDQLIAQADQFIGPKLTPARDDPDYGAMNCGAPLSNALGLPATAVPALPPVPGETPGEPAVDVPATDMDAPVN